MLIQHKRGKNTIRIFSLRTIKYICPDHMTSPGLQNFKMTTIYNISTVIFSMHMASCEHPSDKVFYL